MDMYHRREYVRDLDDVTRSEGVWQRNTVSNMEIWCECFGKPREDMTKMDSNAIAQIMLRMPGWERTDTSARIPIYGKQRLYRRK